MILSMTGFGRGNAAVGGVDISVELQSVNRRALELGGSLPREWAELEQALQALLRERLDRGKVNYSIKAQPAASAPGFHWDEAGLESSLQRLGTLAQRHGISWPPDASGLVQLASMNRVEVALPPADSIREVLLGACGVALDGLLEMRAAEGQALKQDLSRRLEQMRGFLADVEEASKGTVPAYREMLLQRLQRAGLELDVTDERVLKEVAIFADRCDISEETTRLLSHFEQFSKCLADGSPVGRKLDFIVQEMHRELNTMGSKASQPAVSQAVIEAKNELERIREQIQNIE